MVVWSSPIDQLTKKHTSRHDPGLVKEPGAAVGIPLAAARHFVGLDRHLLVRGSASLARHGTCLALPSRGPTGARRPQCGTHGRPRGGSPRRSSGAAPGPASRTAARRAPARTGPVAFRNAACSDPCSFSSLHPSAGSTSWTIAYPQRALGRLQHSLGDQLPVQQRVELLLRAPCGLRRSAGRRSPGFRRSLAVRRLPRR